MKTNQNVNAAATKPALKKITPIQTVAAKITAAAVLAKPTTVKKTATVKPTASAPFGDTTKKAKAEPKAPRITMTSILVRLISEQKLTDDQIVTTASKELGDEVIRRRVRRWRFLLNHGRFSQYPKPVKPYVEIGAKVKPVKPVKAAKPTTEKKPVKAKAAASK